MMLGKCVATLVLGAVLLSGCSSGESDVKAELQALGSKTQARIPKMPEAEAIQIVPYEDAALRDPFIPSWGGAGAAGPSGGKQPDMGRTKEPLESYPLDSIKMVGSLARAGRITGVVRVGATLYQVAVGNYMGTDFGRVTKITGDAIELHETVQDANNIWTERTTSLPLEEPEVKK